MRCGRCIAVVKSVLRIFPMLAMTLKAAPIGVPFSMRQLAASAVRLAVDLDHPVYDCFYLALAIQEQYPVVTADARFHGKVSRHPYLADRITHVASLDLD